MKPKVSIIVPIYNVEPYFEECVDSLRKQTMEDIEIILVDDGSPDGCPAMCDRFAAEDERIRVIHQENAGVSVARNRGIDIAAGDWLMFVDPDDWLEENAVEVLYNKALESGCGIICASYYEEYPGSQKVYQLNPGETGVYKEERDLSRMIANTFMDKYGCVQMRTPCGKLYRKYDIVHEQHRFPEELKFGEDLIFNLYVIQSAKRICVLDVPVFHYRMRAGSASHIVHKDEQYTICRYVKELNSCMNTLQFFNKIRPYYDCAVANGIYFVCNMSAAQIGSRQDFDDAVMRLKRICSDPECQGAIKSAKITRIIGKRQKLLLSLLKCHTYRIATVVSFLVQKWLHKEDMF